MDRTRVTFATFAKSYFLFCLIVSCISPVYSAKKCSRTLRRIPVHKGFDLNKFAGTWFTVTRTTTAWGENTFESFSLEVQKSEDGSFDFSFTGQQGDKCLPVESGKLVRIGRHGQYKLRIASQTDNHPTLIISFTDYKNLALVYYCFKYRPGSRAQCQKNGMQIEIISKDLNPNKKALNGYIKRSGKRLCAPAKLLEATQPGLCKIPEILAAAKQRAKDLKDADSKPSEKDHCAVNNIPLQKNFNSSQLKGLWYEIARTRFTFNKMESVVNFHRYDESTNQIYSYYTGTIVNSENDDSAPTCMTAIQGMSKTVENAESDSDRLGKIGWDDNSFQWSPTKVIYADDDYILFYACYSGETDEPCNKFAMEVSLSGRTRDISDEKRDAIYKILESCINPDDMTQTQFLSNCSSWVTIQPEDVQPEDCKLDEIQVYDDYINSQMVGTWYLYSSISYNNMTSLNGVIMEKTLTPGIEGIETRLVAFSPDTENCTEYRSRSRDMCIDTADHIALLPTGDGNFVFSKVLYLDEELLVEYTCSFRTLDGTCDRNGIQLNVFSKNDTTDEDFILTDDQQDMINSLAKGACLDPNDMELESVWCNMTNATTSEDSTASTDQCDVDAITTFSDVNEYAQDKIYGYWYEISRSSQSAYRPAVTSAIAYFTSPSNETLNVYYTGLLNRDLEEGEDATCSEVLHGSMIARCNNDINGDSLYRFNEAETFVSYIPYKIIYTDYVNVLVTYMCTEMLEHGQCSETGEEIILWSRNETLDEDFKQDTFELAFWICLTPDMVDSHHDNSACRSNLEEYVTDNHIGIYDDDETIDDYSDDEDDDGEDDESENPNEQRDQGKNKYELSDIEALLWMNDDEFYYDS